MGLPILYRFDDEWVDKSTQYDRKSLLNSKHGDISGIHWIKSSQRYSDIKIERRDTITANLKPSAEYTKCICKSLEEW